MVCTRPGPSPSRRSVCFHQPTPIAVIVLETCPRELRRVCSFAATASDRFSTSVGELRVTLVRLVLRCQGSR